MVNVSFDRCVDCFDERPSLPEPLMDELLERLVDELGEGALILEIGAGTGRFTIPLQARGIRIVAADISRAMIVRARAKGAADAFVADAMRLPFRGDAFEATLTVSVLHLVGSWREALHEIARVTRGRHLNVFETHRLYRLPGRGGSPDPYDPLGRYMETAGPPWQGYSHPSHQWGDEAQQIESPESRVRIGPRSQVVEGNLLLRLLEARSYSPQWPVPDSVHTKVIDRLRTEMAGRRFDFTSEVEIIVWNPDALRRM